VTNIINAFKECEEQDYIQNNWAKGPASWSYGRWKISSMFSN